MFLMDSTLPASALTRISYTPFETTWAVGAATVRDGGTALSVAFFLNEKDE